MAEWVSITDRRPDEGEAVTVRVRGRGVRPDYYRIDGRWYSLLDLDRWRMNTSPYWPADQAWYLQDEHIDAWKGQGREPEMARNS